MIRPGDTLLIDHGQWANGPATEAGYAYQWYRGTALGQNMQPVVGATSQSYVVQAGDLFHTFQASVTATNSLSLSTTVFTNVTAEVGTPFGPGTDIPGWLYGQAMPAWLRVGGVEVANWARTWEYLRAGLQPFITPQAATVCGILYDPDRQGTGLTFVDPATDPAPWYDGGRPESTQFLGIVVNSVKVTPVTGRSATNLPGRYGGATLSPISSGGMQLAVSATLISQSCSGADYGEEWLRSVLQDPLCDTCGTQTIEFRNTCPPADNSDDQLGYWIAYQCGVTDGPTAGGEDLYCAMRDVSWTWTSEEAYLYKPPVSGVPATILNPADTPSAPCIAIDDWLCGPGAMLDCATIQPPNKGTWGTIITIQSPDGVGAITLDTYTSCPPTLGVDTPESSMLVTGVHGTLIIDSSQHLITYIDPLGNVHDGTNHIFVPAGQALEWIEVEDCDDAKCVCIAAQHPCSGGGNTTVAIDLQYRRR